MKLATKEAFKKFVARTVAVAVGVIACAIVIGVFILVGSYVASCTREPTPAEAATIQKKVDAAKQQMLEQIAAQTQAGSNTAFVPLNSRGYWVDGTNGYFYIYADDITSIVDIFCNIHSVRVTAPPMPVYSGEYNNIIGYTIVYEPREPNWRPES